MELNSLFQTLYSIAEGYGIPASAVNVVLTFALVLIFGRPIISLFLHISYRRLSELSPETKSSYIGIIHIVALAITTLSAFLDLRLAAALAFVFLVVMPTAAGFITSRGERKEKATQSIKQQPLQQALKGKKEEVKPEKVSTNRTPGKTEKKKRITLKFRFPSLPLPKISKQPKEQKKEGKAYKVKSEQKGPTLIVEEITFKKEMTYTQKTPAKASIPSSKSLPVAIKLPAKKTPMQVPPAETVKIKEFRKAVRELETLAGTGTEASRALHSVPSVKQTVHKTISKPAKVETVEQTFQQAPSVDEGALVKEVEKVVEEKVIRARKHKFITWREALEMRKRAKETVRRIEPVVKEHVRRRLQEKGTLTKEDLNEIAEEILYQIQRSETPTKTSKEYIKKKETEKKERTRRHRREKKKEEKEEDLFIGGGEGEEDILALLGEEESEEDIGGDLEELEKLLGEE